MVTDGGWVAWIANGLNMGQPYLCDNFTDTFQAPFDSHAGVDDFPMMATSDLEGKL